MLLGIIQSSVALLCITVGVYLGMSWSNNGWVRKRQASSVMLVGAVFYGIYSLNKFISAGLISEVLYNIFDLNGLFAESGIIFKGIILVAFIYCVLSALGRRFLQER